MLLVQSSTAAPRINSISLKLGIHNWSYPLPAPLDEPITPCKINLFANDKAWLERRFGRGWTEQVRAWVRTKIKEATHNE